jgi:hypothetical protein
LQVKRTIKTVFDKQPEQIRQHRPAHGLPKKPANNNPLNLIPRPSPRVRHFPKKQKTSNHLIHKEISALKPFTLPITVKTLLLTKEDLPKIEINRKTTIEVGRGKI